MKNKTLKIVIKLLILIVSIIITWVISIKFIPSAWHLLIGWVSCSIYNGVFDLRKVLEEVED